MDKRIADVVEKHRASARFRRLYGWRGFWRHCSREFIWKNCPQVWMDAYAAGLITGHEFQDLGERYLDAHDYGP